MKSDWDELIAPLPESQQERMKSLREKANLLDSIPSRKKDAISITPEKLEVYLMKLCLDADDSRGILSIDFEEFEAQYQYLKKRVVNPVRLWFPGIYAQMIDIVTAKSIKTCILESAAARNGMMI